MADQTIDQAKAETSRDAAVLVREHRAGVLALVTPNHEVAIALWHLARDMYQRAEVAGGQKS